MSDAAQMFPTYPVSLPRSPAEGAPDPEWVAALVAASVDDEDDAMSATVQAMRDAGLSAEEIAEVYVPEAARHLGEGWCEDQTSFARVTIGCSRLHGALRILGPSWGPSGPPDVNAPSVLVLVAEDIYHTLGATVLSGKLRREGFSVRLWLGARAQDMAGVLQSCDYEVVLISASSGESLEKLRGLVTSVRAALAAPPMVIVGGTVTGDGHYSAETVMSLTGADHVTNDPTRALDICRQVTLLKVQDNFRPTVQARRS